MTTVEQSDRDEIGNLVNRFLSWPLPDSVCSDPCATEQGCPNRTGTNLLTAGEEGDGDHQPDGTVESLETCATMLETYGPECFPANGEGQVHFARAMMDSTAAEIRAFLVTRDDEVEAPELLAALESIREAGLGGYLTPELCADIVTAAIDGAKGPQS